MKKLKLIFLTIAAAILSGCAATATIETVPQPAGDAKAAFPQVAEAFAGGDYAKIEKDLSPELKEQLDKERFNLMLKDLARSGKTVKIEYLFHLRSPVIDSEIWRITLRKKDENNKEIYTDKIIRTVTAALDGRRQIIGIIVQ